MEWLYVAEVPIYTLLAIQGIKIRKLKGLFFIYFKYS